MFKFLLTFLVVAAVAGEFYLLYTGNQAAVWQSKSLEGEAVAALGNNPADYDMLVCRHFDGREIRVSLYRYAEDNLGGFSHCPLLIQSSSGTQFVEYP